MQFKSAKARAYARRAGLRYPARACRLGAPFNCGGTVWRWDYTGEAVKAYFPARDHVRDTNYRRTNGFYCDAYNGQTLVPYIAFLGHRDGAWLFAPAYGEPDNMDGARAVGVSDVMLLRDMDFSDACAEASYRAYECTRLAAERQREQAQVYEAGAQAAHAIAEAAECCTKEAEYLEALRETDKEISRAKPERKKQMESMRDAAQRGLFAVKEQRMDACQKAAELLRGDNEAFTFFVSVEARKSMQGAIGERLTPEEAALVLGFAREGKMSPIAELVFWLGKVS